MIRQIRLFLSKLGYQLLPATIINQRGKTIHPLALINDKVNLGTFPSILLDIPVTQCRTQLWNTLEADQSPFVKTIIEYSNHSNPSYNLSPLKTYYECYAPKNAAEVLRLKDNNALEQIPPAGYILPWDSLTADAIMKKRKDIARRENKKEGKQLSLSAGHTDFGPVNAEKGEIEFNRLTRIYNSIKKHGYQENPFLPDGGIRGYFLIGENNEWCFIIKSGKHRAYALSALGYRNIPVIADCNIAMVKRSTDIPFWPQVKNGIFSEKEADFLIESILNLKNHD